MLASVSNIYLTQRFGFGKVRISSWASNSFSCGSLGRCAWYSRCGCRQRRSLGRAWICSRPALDQYAVKGPRKQSQRTAEVGSQQLWPAHQEGRCPSCLYSGCCGELVSRRKRQARTKKAHRSLLNSGDLDATSPVRERRS